MKKKFAFIGLLTVYGIILLVLLTVARMPMEKVLAAKLMEASAGRVALHIEEFDPVFPDKAVLKNVLFRIQGGGIDSQVRLDALRVHPDYTGLFRGYIPVRFQGATPGGTVRGRIGWSPGKGFNDGYVQVHTQEFVLERFPSVGALLDRDITGRLSAEVNIRGDLEGLVKAEGSGTLRIDNGALEADLGLPGLQNIPFESLDMTFTLDQGNLVLSRAEMTGPAFSGGFQGDIALREPLQRSRLRLQGELTPGHMVLENAFLSRFLQKVLKGEQSVRVRVRGTLQSPSIARSKG